MNDYENFWARVAGLSNCAPEFLSDDPATRRQRIKDWFQQRHDTITTWSKWISTVIMLVAAVCVSLDLRPYHIWFLNLGSASWLITAILWREWSLIVVNATLLGVYFVGFIRTLG